MFGDMSEDGEELVVSLNAVKGSGMLRSRRYTPSPSPSPSAASVGATSDSSSSESEESDLSVEMIETDEKDEPGDEKYVICVNIQIHLLINLCAEDLKISLFLTMCSLIFQIQ